ncbi:hypothetical protein GALL_498220 [mine drainage metagenome]|uniref:Uncharacterized protein n=1 Tax=mine drainage metagenome TaxID=410659 RepID=A0A1J5PLC3_9ZZZZ
MGQGRYSRLKLVKIDHLFHKLTVDGVNQPAGDFFFVRFMQLQHLGDGLIFLVPHQRVDQLERNIVPVFF